MCRNNCHSLYRSANTLANSINVLMCVCVKMSPASSSISRLSRLCRRSPGRMSSASGSGGSDWTTFRRQMSYSSEFGSAVGESFLVVDEIQESRRLHQQQLYQQQQHHCPSLGLHSQHPQLRLDNLSPEPVSLRLVEPASSGLAYLERGTSLRSNSLSITWPPSICKRVHSKWFVFGRRSLDYWA